MLVWRTGDRVILPRQTNVLVRQRSYGLTKAVWHYSDVGLQDRDIGFAAWDVRLMADADGNEVYDEGTDDVLIPNDPAYAHVRATFDNVTDGAGQLLVWRTGDRVILPRQTNVLVRQRSYGLTKAVWHYSDVGLQDRDIGFAAWDLSLVIPDPAGDAVIPDDGVHEPVRITIHNVKDAGDELIEWRTGAQLILPRETNILMRKRSHGLSKAEWHLSGGGRQAYAACFARVTFGCSASPCPHVTTIDQVEDGAGNPIEFREFDAVILPPDLTVWFRVDDGIDSWTELISGGFGCGEHAYDW